MEIGFPETGLPGGLPPHALRRRCEPASLAFSTTAELQDLDTAPGQERALEAIEFGVGMRREGYNLFAMGPEGAGRHTLVLRYLQGHAAKLPLPEDWCYVFNFDTPHKPRALRLPAGRAAAFKAAMERLVADLGVALPAAFETDPYRARRRQIEGGFTARSERAIKQIGERAKQDGIGLVQTPAGFGFGPLAKDESMMSPEEFQALPEDERKRYEQLVARYQEEMQSLLQEVPKWRREAMRALRALNREVTGTTIHSLLDELEAAYRDLPQVHAHLTALEEDMLEHAEAFRPAKDGEAPLFALPEPEAEEMPLRRYAVNLLVEHAAGAGAPVVYEDNPTHDALVGRIEHLSQMGTLTTDFTLIKAGALHRANGGYLVLDAMRLLTQPYSWEALKRALRSREIRTQSLGQALGLVSTVTLEPEPIPLEAKVVLVGERLLYYLLHAYDPEFADLFKVPVDFEEELPRGAANDLAFARAIATCARREKLRAFDRGAVAAVIDEQSREAGDASKIAAGMRALVDLLRESDYWAASAGREVVGEEDVRRAIDARIARSDRLQRKSLEDMLRGSHLIDTTGSRVGQVNGLAMVQLGELAFGVPQRITARVRLGSGRVVDIERESELGGPIHSKGVLILSGYLSGRYAAHRPLSLGASLVFEQSYGGVEGDSASSAELYALLSALAEAPVRQGLAVTGSVNQHGDIQPVGGVNQKIEGFFDLCRPRGLTGEQGVLIPRANVQNLMLRPDVVDAVAQGRFNVYAVATVDEGIARLTGLPAEAVHARVEKRLAEFADSLKGFVAVAAHKPWQAKAPPPLRK